jgi:Zn finger protein HypA/HybF involved in hydrogenase expression
MGSQVIAKCDCGVEESILIGGGMFTETLCYFPCLCESCHRIVEVNLLDRPVSCPACHAPDPIPYDDPRLLGAAGRHMVADWYMKAELGRELVLTDGKYRCPKCGKMSLEFSEGGLYWD